MLPSVGGKPEQQVRDWLVLENYVRGLTSRIYTRKYIPAEYAMLLRETEAIQEEDSYRHVIRPGAIKPGAVMDN